MASGCQTIAPNWCLALPNELWGQITRFLTANEFCSLLNVSKCLHNRRWSSETEWPLPTCAFSENWFGYHQPYHLSCSLDHNQGPYYHLYCSDDTTSKISCLLLEPATNNSSTVSVYSSKPNGANQKDKEEEEEGEKEEGYVRDASNKSTAFAKLATAKTTATTTPKVVAALLSCNEEQKETDLLHVDPMCQPQAHRVALPPPADRCSAILREYWDSDNSLWSIELEYNLSSISQQRQPRKTKKIFHAWDRHKFFVLPGYLIGSFNPKQSELTIYKWDVQWTSDPEDMFVISLRHIAEYAQERMKLCGVHLMLPSQDKLLLELWCGKKNRLHLAQFSFATMGHPRYILDNYPTYLKTMQLQHPPRHSVWDPLRQHWWGVSIHRPRSTCFKTSWQWNLIPLQKCCPAKQFWRFVVVGPKSASTVPTFSLTLMIGSNNIEKKEDETCNQNNKSNNKARMAPPPPRAASLFIDANAVHVVSHGLSHA